MRQSFTPIIPTGHLEMDATMDLALHNLRYGLLKIQHVLAATGGGNVYFLPTPDLSTTSNRIRWRSGFCYGGLLRWTSDRCIQFPELRPNACGVLLGRQPRPFDLEALRGRVADAKARFKEDWDYCKGNHFIGLYRRDEEWYFLLHGGTRSIKNRLGLFEGLQASYPSEIFKRCKQALTPLGSFHFLIDADAEEYFSLFKKEEAAIKSRREALAEYLFPHSSLAFHETHQGMLAPTVMALGSYVLGGQFSPATYIPFMITHGEPLLLVEGGLHSEILAQDAEDPQIIPHGSGDYLSELLDFQCLRDREGRPVYTFNLSNGTRIIADTPCELKERHRSKEWAVHALMKLRANVTAQLDHIESVA